MKYKPQLSRILLAFLLLPYVCLGNPVCEPLEDGDLKDPQAILKRAIEAVGIPKVQGKILHFQNMLSNVQDYQSDRTYPPFFSAISSGEVWFDPQSGAERITTQTVFPGGGPSPASTTLSGAQSLFVVRDSGPTQIPGSPLTLRRLNAWAVLLDWRDSSGIAVIGREMYRDYQRIVLSRKAG